MTRKKVADKKSTLHPILQKAYDVATAHITKALKDHNLIEEERARLKALSKDELIEMILELKGKKAHPVKVEDLVYSILCDPNCAWLNYDMIATLLRDKIPTLKTTAENLRWYNSRARAGEKNYEVVPRANQKEITKLILKSINE